MFWFSAKDWPLGAVSTPAHSAVDITCSAYTQSLNELPYIVNPLKFCARRKTRNSGYTY